MGESEAVMVLPAREGLPRKPRIVFATNTVAYGGGEQHLLWLLERLDIASVQPVILCFDENPFSKVLNGELRREIELRKVKVRSSFWDFRRAFVQAKPDIVCFVLGSHQSFTMPAYFAARCSTARSVVAIEHHVSADAFLPSMVRYPLWKDPLRPILGWRTSEKCRRRAKGWLWAKLIDLTVCVSRAVQDADVNAYCIPKRATAVVLNGVDVNHFSLAREQSNLKGQLGVAETERLLLHVGRLVKTKRLDLLLEACARLRAQQQQVTCLIVGEGPLEKDLRRQAQELSIALYVRFLGFQPDLRPFYRGADLFVLPSREEGFGLVLAEAMACGLPCVATRVGGVPEVITDGVDGWLVEPESAEALAEAVQMALGHGARLKQYSARGRAKVVERFNVDKQAREMLRVLFGELALRTCQQSSLSGEKISRGKAAGVTL